MGGQGQISTNQRGAGQGRGPIRARVKGQRALNWVTICDEHQNINHAIRNIFNPKFKIDKDKQVCLRQCTHLLGQDFG